MNKKILCCNELKDESLTYILRFVKYQLRNNAHKQAVTQAKQKAMKKSTKTKPAVYKTVLIEDEMGLAYIRVKTR